MSVDWELGQLDKLPTEEVRCYMTADPVTCRPSASLRALCRMMIDAHVHRVVVVDDDQRPVGIISSTDVLGAVAYSEP
jgi:CBS domain-containing protein